LNILNSPTAPVPESFVVRRWSSVVVGRSSDRKEAGPAMRDGIAGSDNDAELDGARDRLFQQIWGS
jgi:hypothetical protein